ncbi:(2Fe-2S) ferredoxin domain-containing protein [Desulfovibrio aminophilus]|nr:(2Fe-2S) ferredoxin domain-containing protein [Desulfovibrio aminophilus]MCM0756377.1 (2Fe-2S) ferredoxin domain-containing protein [Desulfovibrio aminophilus]
MEKPTHHIIVCASFRVAGEPKGACHKKGSVALLPYLEEQVLDRGLDALVSACGCMKQCEDGPMLVVYPENHWYGHVEGEDAVDAILDALEKGEVCPDYALA